MPRKPTATDCLQAQRPDVAATWHPTWNGDKTPQNFLRAARGAHGWRQRRGPEVRLAPWTHDL